MTLPETIYTDLKDQLPALTEALKTGAEWGTDLAHRFIVYDIWVNALQIGATLCILTPMIALSFWLLKKRAGWEKEANQYDKHMPTVIVVAVVFILALLALFISSDISLATKNIIKDIFIPELRIIEVLQDVTLPTEK